MKEKEELYYNIEEEGEEGDSLYSLPEDEEDAGEQPSAAPRRYEREEDYPYAYGQADAPADDEADDEAAKAGVSRGGSAWGLLLKAMFSPVEGWKALKRSRISPEALAGGVFYPMCALAAVSQFAPMVYETGREWTALLITAVITFISFFFSNLLIPPLGRLILGEGAKETIESPFGRKAVMVLLATLAAFKAIFSLLPPLDVVTVFLPIWTIYMISRLPATLRAPKTNKTRVAVLMSVLVLGVPYAWDRLLELIL